MITRAAALARHPGAACFTFGDSRELCDHLLALVRAGRKTATCGAAGLRTVPADLRLIAVSAA